MVAASTDPLLDLGEVGELARALLLAEVKTAEAEDALKAAKENERRIREEALPLAMAELGLEKVRLDTGHEITVKMEVYASIPAAGKDAAYSWLEEHGFGGLIKTDVKASFTRDEIELARALLAELQAQDYSVEMTRNVHAQTLKAWLREQLAGGAAVPLELFGANPVNQAKVKAPKEVKR